jgi:hypothetical protein
MQNQTAPTFTGKQDRGIPFGEFVLTRGNSPEPALPTSGFGTRDAASLGVDFAPWPFVGTAKSAVELVAGYDYIAGKPTSRVFAAVGIFAGILPMGKGLLKGATKTIGAIGRTADDAADVARVAGRVDAVGVEARLTSTVFDLRAAGLKDAHHVVQDAAVRNLPGYNSQLAPGVHLPGPSTLAGTAHYLATQVQRQPGGGTLAAELRIGYKAIRRAGFAEAEARKVINETYDYFRSIGATPSTPTRIPGNR